jgi:hypothetical protein
MADFSEEKIAVLRKFNDALLEGLKAAVLVLENYSDFSEDKRTALTAELRNLISQNQVMEVIYGNGAKEH